MKSEQNIAEDIEYVYSVFPTIVEELNVAFYLFFEMIDESLPKKYCRVCRGVSRANDYDKEVQRLVLATDKIIRYVPVLADFQKRFEDAREFVLGGGNIVNLADERKENNKRSFSFLRPVTWNFFLREMKANGESTDNLFFYDELEKVTDAAKKDVGHFLEDMKNGVLVPKDTLSYIRSCISPIIHLSKMFSEGVGKHKSVRFYYKFPAEYMDSLRELYDLLPPSPEE